MGRAGVELGQRGRHQRLAEPGEPSGLLGGQLLAVAPHHFDEHELGHAGEHGVAARPVLPRLGHDLAGELRQPAGRDPAHRHAAGQGGEQRVVGTGVASEEAAD